MNVVALIAAAGRGTRMRGELEKQFMLLGDKPLLVHTVEHFQQCDAVDRVIISVALERVEYCRQEIVANYQLGKVAAVVPGGKVRQESVYRALQRVSPATDLVVTHDGVRPFLFGDVLVRAIGAARECGAAVVAVPESDTVKEVSREGVICGTMDRRRLWRVQTPQVFAYDVLHEAFARASADGYVATDEAELVERTGHEVRVVPGSIWNIKITAAEDMALAEFLLARAHGSADGL